MAILKNGALNGRGGRREGAGRKPSEFIAKCKNLSEDPNFFKWVKRVFAGEDTEIKIIDKVRVSVPATATEKTYLWEKISAYGQGKPSQSVNLTAGGGIADLLTSAVSAGVSDGNE